MTNILLKTGTLIIGDGRTLNDVSVLIKDDVISEVGPDVRAESGSEVLDYSDRVVMPGIIDTHVHVGYDGIAADPDEVRLLSDEFLSIRGGVVAERLINNGITTAGDAASRGNISFAVREAIEKGVVNGPRLLVCGRMISITGGRDPMSGYSEANGVDDVRRAVREEIARGIHFIKLASTGAISAMHTESMSPQFNLDELKAAAEESHKVGKMAHAHAYGDVGIQNTILAGVDVLVHGHPLNKENIDLMKKHGTMYMPTIVTYYESQLHHDDGDLPEYMVRKEKEIYPLIEAGVKNAVKAGLEMVVGSDSGMPYTPFGPSTMEEMELMVRIGGMLEMDAIVAGTLNAARALKIDSQIGTVEPGKSADILVLAAGKNPLEDISLLKSPESIEQVILKGKTVIKH
ncbi:MAG: amidohydrolase family protein [Candidatus Thorarchaeota archaeon]